MEARPLAYRPNVWLGTSVSNQATADKQLPELLKCRDLCPVLFVSAEPLLGPIEFTSIKRNDGWTVDALRGVYSRHHDAGVDHPEALEEWGDGPKFDWVILGGESGSDSRACDLDWNRSGVRQCREAGVACFVKQLGSRPGEWIGPGLAPGSISLDTYDMPGGEPDDEWHPLAIRDKKGGDVSEWPEDLRVREFPREIAR